MATLRQIPTYLIKENPDNPRLIFRQEEMEQLMRSIDRHGIQVPVSVYRDGNSFRLIDGERRWKCAKLLNKKSIPAIVQEKPSPLENLIMMYNIHALREQWDYFTIASKLGDLIELFEKERGSKPNEIELSEETGLSRGQIRRCRLIIDLPDKFKEIILQELEKPKSKQKLTEDFFIEMEKSLKTVVGRVPGYSNRMDSIRDALIKKFEDNKIKAVTDFRLLSKIATAIEGLGLERKKALRSLDRIFEPGNDVGIVTEYRDVVEFEYEEKSAIRSINNVGEFLEEVIADENYDELDTDFIYELKRLGEMIKKILGALDADDPD